MAGPAKLPFQAHRKWNELCWHHKASSQSLQKVTRVTLTPQSVIFEPTKSQTSYADITKRHLRSYIEKWNELCWHHKAPWPSLHRKVKRIMLTLQSTLFEPTDSETNNADSTSVGPSYNPVAKDSSVGPSYNPVAKDSSTAWCWYNSGHGTLSNKSVAGCSQRVRHVRL